MQGPTVIVEKSEADVARDAARFWWVVVLLAVASLVAGVIFVAKPSNSLATLAVVFGIFLLLDGIAEVISSFRRGEGHRAMAAILGVLGIVIGIILIRHPTHVVNAIGLVIGIWLVAAGVVRLARAVVNEVNRVVQVVIALLEIVIGIAVVSEPHIGYGTLAILVGIWLIINAIGLVVLGLMLRRIRSDPAAYTAP